MKILDVGFVHDGQIAVAKVVKAQGIKGEIKAYPFSGRPEDFLGYRQLTLVEAEHGLTKPYEVEQSRPLGNFVILRLVGLSGRNAAEDLRGWEVRVASELLRSLEPGTFYWHELEWLPVIDDAGRNLGRITSFLATAAHDILVITGAGGEYLIPAIDECVAGIAPDGKALVVTPPPGLLEMNSGGMADDVR